MSLNLGTPTVQAAAALRPDPHFEQVRAGLAEVVQARVNAALDAPVEQRVEATAYARAIRDVWVALEAATLGVRPAAVATPRLKVKPANSEGIARDV